MSHIQDLHINNSSPAVARLLGLSGLNPQLQVQDETAQLTLEAAGMERGGRLTPEGLSAARSFFGLVAVADELKPETVVTASLSHKLSKLSKKKQEASIGAADLGV